MLRIIMAAIFLAALVAIDASAQGVFEKLEGKRKEVIVDTRSPNRTGRSPFSNAKQQPETSQSADEQGGAAIESSSDLYGRWQGMVKPPGRGYSMSAIGLDVLIAPGFAKMSVSASVSRCLAELKPAEALGEFEAAFVDESRSCGSRATIVFSRDGHVSVDWTDMPGLDSEKRSYVGQLSRTGIPREPLWSASAEQRATFDVVGFKLGMSYEDALSYRETDHPDLVYDLGFVVDKGTVSNVVNLKEKSAKQVGAEVFGEQLTLYFEAQTNEERAVEQDPEVLARLEEREKIIARRDEMVEEMAQQAASRNRDNRSRSELPQVPEMPRLRPEGAHAELMFVSRRLRFSSNGAPHQDNVIKAMSEKYGNPSIHIKDLSSMGGRHQLAWVFDASNNRIQEGEGSACDHLSKNEPQRDEPVRNYSTGRMLGIFNPVTVSPECGLTVKAVLNVGGDGSVYEMSTTVYDQQRLLGDEWHRVIKLGEAELAGRRAETRAIKERETPDF